MLWFCFLLWNFQTTHATSVSSTLKVILKGAFLKVWVMIHAQVPVCKPRNVQ